MEDNGFSLSKQALRILVRLTSQIEEVSDRFEGMDDLKRLLRFAASNTRPLLEEKNRDLWKKAEFKGSIDIEGITRDVGVLIWLALSLGRAINQYRAILHKRPINWEKYAEGIDQDEKKASHAQPL